MKKLNRKTLIKKLDKVFSQYIRRKYTKKGYGRCYTCRAIKPYEELDSSHYISRQHLATRWDERNAKVCCQKCNRFLSGNLDEFALALQREYGDDILLELNKDKWTPRKINELEIMALIEEYQEKLKKLSEN